MKQIGSDLDGLINNWFGVSKYTDDTYIYIYIYIVFNVNYGNSNSSPDKIKTSLKTGSH
jgi:hypothetical protein